MVHTDFGEWKDVAKNIGSNFTHSNEVGDEQDIKIADIKIVQFYKNEPRVMNVKTSYKQDQFLKIKVDECKPKKEKNNQERNPQKKNQARKPHFSRRW